MQRRLSLYFLPPSGTINDKAVNVVTITGIDVSHPAGAFCVNISCSCDQHYDVALAVFESACGGCVTPHRLAVPLVVPAGSHENDGVVLSFAES